MGHLKTSKVPYLFVGYMINTILGIKKGMTSRFDKRGHQVAVTQIAAEPNAVVSKKEDEVQLGFGRKKKFKKTENAYVKNVGYAPKFIKEVRIDKDQQEIKIGDKVTVSIFEPGDLVKVTGITSGKGFTGVVKRGGFAGGPKTHGQSDRHRAPGSIGQTTTPGRVFKGKKMAGHVGASQKTIIGLEVVEVDSNKNLILVKGAVPGSRNGFLIIEKTGKIKSYTPAPPPKEKEEEPATSPRTSNGVGQVKDTEAESKVHEELIARDTHKSTVPESNEENPVATKNTEVKQNAQ